MDSPIRVAYTVMQSWHRVPGGSTSSVLSLAKALRARDDVELTGVGPWFGGVPPEPWRPPMKVVRIPAPYSLIYDIWHHTRLFAPPWVVANTDVIHATTATVPTPGKAGLVVTLHDLFPLTNPEQFTKRGRRIMTEGIERAQRLADMVCVPSQHSLDECVRAGFQTDRLRVVPWGVTHVEVTDDDRRRVRERYDLTRPFILWVGTLARHKNLSTLLDAYGKLQPLKEDLVLVGSAGWQGGLQSHLHGVGSKVRQLGFVPAQDLSALYAEAKVLCLPSTRAGFGFPALEAMSQGTAVISGVGTAAAEVAGESGFTVAGSSVDAWAEALDALLDDPPELERLGVIARERSGEYSWERCAEQMTSVYREVSR